MSNWESWHHLMGLELLKDYKPQTPVQFLHATGSNYIKFKEWRGIISHLVHKANKEYHCAIKSDGLPDILICTIWNDLNAQIVIEKFDDEYLKKYGKIIALDKYLNVHHPNPSQLETA